MTELRRMPRKRTVRSRLTVALTVALTVGALSAVVAVAALAQNAGKSTFIGKLEGREVGHAGERLPKGLKEAPQLAELVKAGKLPPVAERVGQDPVVIRPLHATGKSGATGRGGSPGPADFWNGFRCCSGPDHLMFWDYTGDKALPTIAKGLEMQDGGRAWLVHLRRGMKWSDGKPFTSDDFTFWFEDIYRNKDLVPTPSAQMAINGKQGSIEKVDTNTVRFKFPEPYFMLPDVLAGATDLAGQGFAYRGMGGFAPAHYLKQFHPKYVGQAELDKKVKDAKFDSWVRMFLAKNDWALNPELPVLSPWKTVTAINTTTWTLERNPYSVFVDTAGNQLPYIDRVVLTLGENLEVINLRAVAGEYDFQQRHLDLGKLPVFIENQVKGGYKVYLDLGDARRPEGQRDARQDRPGQERRPGLPATQRRQGPAAHRDHDAGRPVRPVHADRGDDPRAVEEDRHRPDRAGGRAQPGAQADRRQRAAARRLEQRRQRAPVHVPASRVPLRARRGRLLWAAVRQVVPLRRRPGQGAGAEDARADGKMEEGLRRAREGAHPARQGGLEDRRRGGLHHRRDRHGAGLHGRTRGQDEHGQHSVAAVQQPGWQDPGDLATDDVLLEELDSGGARVTAARRR